jgi:hypothetical protein
MSDGSGAAGAAARQALVRMAWTATERLDGLLEGGRPGTAAAAAAAELVELARTAGADELADLLCLGPGRSAVTATVACFAIGALRASEVVDFVDVGAAVRRLAQCEDADHVAAQLTVSTSAGLQWTVLTRTAAHVELALPSPPALTHASGDAAAVEAVRRWWAERLARWATADAWVGPGPLPDQPAHLPDPGDPAGVGMALPLPAAPSPPEGSPETAASPAALGQLADAVAVLSAAVVHLAEAVDRLAGAVDSSGGRALDQARRVVGSR